MGRTCNTDIGMTPADQWTYEERPNQAGWLIVIPVLILLLVASVTAVMTDRSRGMALAIVIAAAGITIYAFRALARNAVVIDRRCDIVRIAAVGAPWRHREVRTLSDFDRVAVWERRTPIDTGYFASKYSIVLLGGKGPLPLLTTDDEREASAVRNEVALFLRFK